MTDKELYREYYSGDPLRRIEVTDALRDEIRRRVDLVKAKRKH